MKFNLMVIIIFFGFSVFSQEEVTIYTERQGTEVVIYANNASVIPMTVDIKLKLTNMKTDFGGKSGLFVIPGKSKRYKITSAQPVNEYGRSGLSLESHVYIGNVDDEHDNDFLYELPFESGKSYVVSQGYNGRFSHRGENAIDFGLDIGEKVFAARGGIVYKVVEKHGKSCRNSSCQQYNNFITVYHSDGTFSEYSHLKKNGANVEEGQVIETGDFIGYSGNTGWSSGPHLHFVVYKYDKSGKRVTLKTKFKTVEKEVAQLIENKKYTRR